MDLGKPPDKDSGQAYTQLQLTITNTKSSRWFPKLSGMVVVRHGRSDEIKNLDQATSLSLQPCSLLSNVPPVVDYRTEVELPWSLYKEEGAAGALGLRALRPTIPQLLACSSQGAHEQP